MTLYTRLTALSTTIENSGLTRVDDKELIDLLDEAREYVEVNEEWKNTPTQMSATAWAGIIVFGMAMTALLVLAFIGGAWIF